MEVEPANGGVSVNKVGLVSATKSAMPQNYKITAYNKGIEKGQITIKVEQPVNPITQIRANQTSLTLYPGQTGKVTLLVKKKSGEAVPARENTGWTFSDSTIADAYFSDYPDVLTVIPYYKTGKTVLTCVAKDGSGKKCTINVTVLMPVKAYVDPGTGNTVHVKYGQKESETIYLARGKTIKPTAIRVDPAYTSGAPASNQKVKFSFNGEPGKGLKLNESTGAITAKADAELKCSEIEASAADGQGGAGYYKVIVTDNSVKGITVSENAVRLFRKTNLADAPTEGELTVSLSGGMDDHFLDQLDVTSSAPGIATAEIAGDDPTALKLKVKATGNATGTATITVASTDGSGIIAEYKIRPSAQLTKITGEVGQDPEDGTYIQITDEYNLPGPKEAYIYSAYGFTIDGKAGGLYGTWDQNTAGKLWIFTPYQKKIPGKYKVTIFRTDGGTQKWSTTFTVNAD
ncbi:MAG: hypothetical protein K6E16_03845 [Lachnospiraceae bacterium]|nr:hypothetical protein [Lachnospiraceae bacterium]